MSLDLDLDLAKRQQGRRELEQSGSRLETRQRKPDDRAEHERYPECEVGIREDIRPVESVASARGLQQGHG